MKTALDQIDHDTSDAKIDSLMKSMRNHHGIGMLNPWGHSDYQTEDEGMNEIPLPLFVLFMFKFKQWKQGQAATRTVATAPSKVAPADTSAGEPTKQDDGSHEIRGPTSRPHSTLDNSFVPVQEYKVRSWCLVCPFSYVPGCGHAVDPARCAASVAGAMLVVPFNLPVVFRFNTIPKPAIAGSVEQRHP